MSLASPLLNFGTQNPFERLDRYGELGRAPQPLTEKARLLFCAIFIVPFKALGTLACLLSYYSIIKIVNFFFPAESSPRAADVLAKLGQIHCRACLFCLGFVRIKWITVLQDEKLTAATPPIAGIVSNHSSWVDILIHMSHSFPSFVARDATKETPIIGAISQAMGCLYVDRTKRPTDGNQHAGVSTLVKQRMMDTAAGRLPHSRPMLLFPEGTTTNGRCMLPFRTGAFLAGAPLQPVIIHYHTGSFSPSWETISAPRHIFLLLCNPVHSATCYELPVHVPSVEEREDPRKFADNVRTEMMKFSGLIDTKLTFEDKMRYHDGLKEKYGMTVTTHEHKQ